MKINKLCNAFFPDAGVMKINFGFLGTPANDAIDKFRSKHGGLWIGGRLIVGDGKLVFRQNAANRAIHTSDHDLCVDLKDIDKVWWKFGWFTGIINIESRNTVLKFRCYGARQVVKILNELIASQQPPAGDVLKAAPEE